LLVCCICNGCELPFGVIKNNNNNKEEEEDKCVFQPIAVESLGPLNETACQFLKDLGRRIPAQSERERESAFLFQRNRKTLSQMALKALSTDGVCCLSTIQCYLLAPQQF